MVVRLAAIAAVVYASGCNQVFGLEKTSVRDAFEPLPQVRLTYQVSSTDDFGAPSAALADAPVPELAVRVGRLDGALESAAYDPMVGTVDIPHAFPGTKWRLEYTIENGTPNEVHWVSPLEGGHVTEPMFGRLDRGEVPAGSGYSITTAGAGGLPPYVAPRLLTTGVWTNTALAPTSTSPVEARIEALTPISGRLGQPDASRRDLGIFVDYKTDPTCNVTRGTSSFSPPSLQPGTLSDVSATWTNVANTNTELVYVAGDDQRLTDALGDRTGVKSSRVFVGFVPHDELPVLLRHHLVVDVPSPPMLPVADCLFGVTAPSTFADPQDLLVFPRVAFAYFAETRTTAGGLALTSSVATAATSATQTFTLDFEIPIATPPFALTLDGGLAIDLSGTEDSTRLPASGALALTFTMGEGDESAADYLRVILYQQTSFLQPVRIFTLTDPTQRELVLDRTILTSGEYVFAIEAHRGQPRTSVGDFSVTRYPQTVSRVFTRTFVVP